MRSPTGASRPRPVSMLAICTRCPKPRSANTPPVPETPASFCRKRVMWPPRPSADLRRGQGREGDVGVPERLVLRRRARLEAGLGVRRLGGAALVDARVRRLRLEDLDVLTLVDEVGDRLQPAQVRVHRALQLGLG